MAAAEEEAVALVVEEAPAAPDPIGEESEVPAVSAPRPTPIYQPAKLAQPPKEDDTTEKGKGGKQHTKVQNLIRRAGQSKDYLSTIEAPAENSTGRIDVFVEAG